MTEGKREEVMFVVPQHRDMDNINAFHIIGNIYDFFLPIRMVASIQPLTREIINSMFSGCMPARRSVQAKQKRTAVANSAHVHIRCLVA